MNRVRQHAGRLESINVQFDEELKALTVPNQLTSSYNHVKVELHAIGNEDCLFTFDSVKIRHLQEKQRSQTRKAKDRKISDTSILMIHRGTNHVNHFRRSDPQRN